MASISGTGSSVPAKGPRCQLAAWQVAQSMAGAGLGSSGSSAASTRFSCAVSSGSRLTDPPLLGRLVALETNRGRDRLAPAPWMVPAGPGRR